MISAPRLFTPEDLHSGQTVRPSEAQTHYLGTVLRRSAGDKIILFNGRDGEWQGRLVGTGRHCQVEIISLTRPQEQEPDMWLAFAPLKRHATDLVAQKATELGVSALLPVITGRTQSERINTSRMQLIVIEAAEQCERLSVPAIHAPQTVSALLADWSATRALYVAAERRAAPMPVAARGRAALFIGPEGGFMPSELDALSTHPFVHPVSLGPRILRAETAAIVGLALLLLSA
jgi:16S rRNA (uracil1498-N3)-methyltransferase